MRQPIHPDTLLDQDTKIRLLEAIRAGVIDMAYFPGIYFPPYGSGPDWSLVSDEEAERFRALAGRIRFDAGRQVVLTRSLRIRLLNAIRAGRINLHADFPDLATAYRKVEQDWSALLPGEEEALLDICIRVNS